MQRDIKELNAKVLRKEIFYKCRKGRETLIFRDEAEYEEHQRENISSSETDEIIEEELPFEETLADKRRKYTAKEKFIYTLYNAILPAFITEWDGYFLRKKPLAKEMDKGVVDGNDEKHNDKASDDSFKDSIKKSTDKENQTFVSDWKLSPLDEYAEVKFYNNNSYFGRISRKVMEGEGIYTWNNGVRYKGEFEENQIRGRGLLEWSDTCSYEGNFVNGFRYGRGIAVDRERNDVYVGQWYYKCIERKNV